MKRLLSTAAILVTGTAPAFAHVGHGATESLAAGIAHPLSGLDHITVMVAVGLWAALKGGKALWAWPAAFVGVMLIGGVLGMALVGLPFVEPTILASVVALGLMVALAIDLPIAVGAAIIGAFALFHGYAHGMEAGESLGGFSYMAGFAISTAALHAAGIGFALFAARNSMRPLVRVAGAVCVVIGAGLIGGVI